MTNETQTSVSEIKDLRAIGQTVTACLFLTIIIIVALVGNTGVILVVTLYRQMRRDISNVLIINLSITDLVNTCTVMLSALISLISDDWILGPIWCDIICAMNYCLIIVSMLTLCCVSIERYQAVVHPLSYQSHVKRSRLILASGYTWVQGAVFAFVPSVCGWVNYDYWEAICAIQWHLYRPGTIIYVVVAFALCFLGPGIILCYCYVKIIKEVRKQKDQVTLGIRNSDKMTKRKMSDKSRIIWSLLVIVFAYFICTTPFSLTKLIKVSVNDTSVIPGPVNLSAALLGYLASAVNPLIYGIFRKDFRRAYLQILKMIFLSQRRSSHLNSPDISTNVRASINVSPYESRDHDSVEARQISNSDTPLRTTKNGQVTHKETLTIETHQIGKVFTIAEVSKAKTASSNHEHTDKPTENQESNNTVFTHSESFNTKKITISGEIVLNGKVSVISEISTDNPNTFHTQKSSLNNGYHINSLTKGDVNTDQSDKNTYYKQGLESDNKENSSNVTNIKLGHADIKNLQDEVSECSSSDMIQPIICVIQSHEGTPIKTTESKRVSVVTTITCQSNDLDLDDVTMAEKIPNVTS